MYSQPMLLELSNDRDILDSLTISAKKRIRSDSRKILLYIGNSRPRGRMDYGLRLIEELENSGNTVSGLIIENDDPLNINPMIQTMKRFFLPAELSGRQSEIKKNFTNSSSLMIIESFIERIKTEKYDAGVVFYGNWVPPQIYTIPENGFINFHPGPLPYLKGMEPDTFAVLEGWKKIWGTVHKVDEHFDTGMIVKRTRKIRIKSYSTPVSILHALTLEGVKTVSKACAVLHKNDIRRKPIRNAEGTKATIEKAFFESFIDWAADSNGMIERRLRAFCGQDIGIRLKCKVMEKLYFVYNLETIKGKFPGNPGEVIGFYMKKGKYLYQPVIRTVNGAVVVLLGQKIESEELKRPENRYYPEWQIPPRKTKRCTDNATIRYSIRQYNDIIRQVMII